MKKKNKNYISSLNNNKNKYKLCLNYEKKT